MGIDLYTQDEPDIVRVFSPLVPHIYLLGKPLQLTPFFHPHTGKENAAIPSPLPTFSVTPNQVDQRPDALGAAVPKQPGND